MQLCCVMLCLWVQRQPEERLCYGCHASQERIKVSSVPMAPSNLSASTLPTLGSANSVDSVNSKKIGIRNRISNTDGKETFHCNILYFFIFLSNLLLHLLLNLGKMQISSLRQEVERKTLRRCRKAALGAVQGVFCFAALVSTCGTCRHKSSTRSPPRVGP